jgi:hypothetical protein
MSLVYPLHILNSSTIGVYNYQLSPENLRGVNCGFCKGKKLTGGFPGNIELPLKKA